MTAVAEPRQDSPESTTKPEKKPIKALLSLRREDADGWLETTRDLPGQSKHAILLGPPGTGKTYSAQRSAAPGQPVYTVTLTAEGTAIQFTGHKEIQNGNTVYWEGIGLKAWREGALLVLNEIDHASEDVLNHLYELLDDQDVAQKLLPSGEIVHPKPGFRVIATTNATPDALPEAIQDRFGLWLPYDEPSPVMYERLDADVAEVVRASYKTAAAGRTARERIPMITYREADAFCDLRKTGMARSVHDMAMVVMKCDTDRADGFTESLASASKVLGR